MNIGETVTVVHTDGSGVFTTTIDGVLDTYLVLFDGVLYWHVLKTNVALDSDGVLRTTDEYTFLNFGAVL